MPRNLLILHAHDMGRYNRAYGHALPTPHMAQLAEEGTLFRNAHCAAPTCSPSRAALLTGKTAHEVGMFGLTHRGWDLRDYHDHLAHHLGQHGWHTAWVGVQHEFKAHARAPYAECIPRPPTVPSERDAASTLAAADWLKQPRERPFFLWVGFQLPHVPFRPADPARFPAGRMQPPPVLPDTPRTRQDWADYAASVAVTDQCVGQILAALADGGHADETLVILTTDHGLPLPHMKCNLTHHGTGVTLIMRGPEVPPGHVTDALVSHLDVFPTICDYLGVAAPETQRGTSLRPLMEGTVEAIRADTFAEVTYHAAYQPMRAVRTTRWNYIRSFEEDRRLPLANIDDTRSKRELMEHGLLLQTTEKEALYDLLYDPQERQNRAADPAYQTIKAEMAERLERWMAATDDPIRHGDIALPAGAKCNTRESLQPYEGPYVGSDEPA